MWLVNRLRSAASATAFPMIILAGIVAGLPGAIGSTAEAVNTGEMTGPFALLVIILVLGTTAFVVFVERAQRRITVNYAKRQVGRRMYAGADQPSAVQAEQFRRDSADLRLEPAAVSGHALELLRGELRRAGWRSSCRTWRRRWAMASRCTL